MYWALFEGLVPDGVFAGEHTEAYVLLLGDPLSARWQNIPPPENLTGEFSVGTAKDLAGVGRI